MKQEYETLCHSKWECKYHVVFIPKCRRKVLCGELRKYLGEVFHKFFEHHGLYRLRGTVKYPEAAQC